MKIDVLNIQGEKTGRQVELPDEIFGIEPNQHVMWLAVKQYLANQRQGTHKAKERNEVSGSTRKLKRQKGTGTARFGDIKNPLFRGGGRVFGPRPRDYSFKLNKKVKRLARKSAFSAKMADGAVVVVEDFTFEAPKTKAMVEVLRNLDAYGKKALVVTPDVDQKVYLSTRNIPKAQVMRAQDVHTYAILDADKVILSEHSIEKIVETFADKAKETANA
ncbi:MAG: 50S ribosomal protein L4 [Bacteroidetes bacterium]|nr:MAG: 50S ribosomal protein L4 [Bacteroidota bacterium]